MTIFWNILVDSEKQIYIFSQSSVCNVVYHLESQDTMRCYLHAR